MKSTAGNKLLVGAIAAIAAISLGACSFESLAEQALETTLEQAAASEGDDIDLELDFSGDSGGFSITTDDGEVDFSLSEDGLFIESEGEEFSVIPDGDGFAIQSDEGSARVDITDTGLTFETDEGTGEVTLDETGLTFETDEASGGFGLGTVPDGWPDEIGVPASLAATESLFSLTESEGKTGYFGAINHDPNEDFFQSVQQRLSRAGFTEDSRFESTDGIGIEMTRSDAHVSMQSDRNGVTVINWVPVS